MYCSLKPLRLGMGEVVSARISPTLHPPSPPTVHQLSRLALEELTTIHYVMLSVYYRGKWSNQGSMQISKREFLYLKFAVLYHHVL